MGTWFSGQWDYYWAWLESGRRVGAAYDEKLNAQLDAHCQIMRSCGWWYPFNDFCIICDRPELIARDDRGLLHSETGFALRFRDGYGFHAWHGIRIPPEWIEDKPSLKPQTALTWQNIEQRRAACEIVGWHRILSELNAETIDKDEDPLIGELVEVDIPDVGREKFLRVTCGTGRRFAIPMPPTIKTALEGNAWSYGVDTQVIRALEFRT